jgi:hypothetical protein
MDSGILGGSSSLQAQLRRSNLKILGYQDRKLYFNGRKQDDFYRTNQNGIHGPQSLTANLTVLNPSAQSGLKTAVS